MTSHVSVAEQGCVTLITQHQRYWLFLLHIAIMAKYLGIGQFSPRMYRIKEISIGASLVITYSYQWPCCDVLSIYKEYRVLCMYVHGRMVLDY